MVQLDEQEVAQELVLTGRRPKILKRSLFPALALALAMLACQNPIQGVSVARPSATPRPVAATATTASVATSPAEATAFAPGQDFTLVRIYPQDGSLQAQLAAEATKAQALGERPFLEFDATWCPPCQAITASLAAKNKLMLSAYAGIYLIHADVDQWGWDNSAAGFPAIQGIPAFFALGSDGAPTGASTDGGAWGADIPGNFAPVLAKFFHP